MTFDKYQCSECEYELRADEPPKCPDCGCVMTAVAIAPTVVELPLDVQDVLAGAFEALVADDLLGPIEEPHEYRAIGFALEQMCEYGDGRGDVRDFVESYGDPATFDEGVLESHRFYNSDRPNRYLACDPDE